MSVCLATLSRLSYSRLVLPLPLIYPLPLSHCSPHSLISLCWARSLPYSFCSGPQAETDLFNKAWQAGRRLWQLWLVDVAFSATGEWIPGRESPDGLSLKQFTAGSPRWAPYGITLHIWIRSADLMYLITWLHSGPFYILHPICFPLWNV